MSEEAPQKFVAYPRGDFLAATYGTPERLALLGRGYFGIARVAAINMVLFAFCFLGLPIGGPNLLLGFFVLLMAFMYVFSLSNVQTIGNGLGWNDSKIKSVAFSMCLTSWFFCGLFGYFALEILSRNELRRYGVRVSWGGVTKKDFEGALHKRQNIEPAPAIQNDWSA